MLVKFPPTVYLYPRSAPKIQCFVILLSNLLLKCFVVESNILDLRCSFNPTAANADALLGQQIIEKENIIYVRRQHYWSKF